VIRYAVLLLLIISSRLAFSQSYTYTYVDPCTKILKEVTIPSGQQNIAVTYYGQVGTFSQADFMNGNFTNWMNSTAAINTNRPCDQLVNQTTTQTNMIVTSNIISTLTNITAVATMSAQLSGSIASISTGGVNNAVGNATTNSNSSGSSSNSNNNNSSGSNNSGSGSGNSGSGGSSNNSGSGSSGSGSGGGSGGSGESGGSGGSGSGGNGTGSGNSSGTTPNPESPTPSQNSGESTATSSGGNGGTSNSISNAAEASAGGESSSGGSGGKSNGGSRARVGTLIGTGDIVAIRSAEDQAQKDQFRFTMSMTKSNTKNTFAKGFLGNFTTSINNSNVTFYGAWNKKSATLIFANSSMINFQRDFFNTTTLLGSKRIKKLSLMGGANFTMGKLGETPFNNLSAVGGGFYMFTPGQKKKITGTILLLGVYSPFTQFYEGRWWDSGLLVVPFSSWDYSITKKFKYNISFSGTYEWNKSVLNYQILTGGKILL
jgi:hypothetical protein